MRWFKWFVKEKPDRYKMTVSLISKGVVEKTKKTRKRTKNKTVSFTHIVHQDHYDLKRAMNEAAYYYKSKGYTITEVPYSHPDFYMELVRISDEREFPAHFCHNLVGSGYSSVKIRT